MKRVTQAIVVPLVCVVIGVGGSAAYVGINSGNDLGNHSGSGSQSGTQPGTHTDAQEYSDAASTVGRSLSYGYLRAVTGQLKGHWLRQVEFGPVGAKATTYGTSGKAFGYITFDARAHTDSNANSGADTGRAMHGYGTFKAALLKPQVLYAAALEAVELAASETERPNTIGLTAYSLNVEYDHGWYGSPGAPKAALITVTVMDTNRDKRAKPMRFAWTVDGKERRTVQS